MNAPQTNDAAISAAAVLVALATWYQGCRGPLCQIGSHQVPQEARSGSRPTRHTPACGPVRSAADLEFATPAAAPDELGRAVPEAGALERGQAVPPSAQAIAPDQGVEGKRWSTRGNLGKPRARHRATERP